jgi:Fe(3+) dicitrate transport protein
MQTMSQHFLPQAPLARAIAMALCVASPLLLGQVSLAQELNVEEVTILGSQEAARKIPGSAHFIGEEQLRQFAYSDVQRIVREVPGVSLQIEDGYGLRPNIGIRGVATERSGRITLLEDNVLIAPAPYSAPSAYYFPTMGRIAAVEVVKGPAAITQGPYTIGGALNMVSTPIPMETEGNLLTEVGEDSTYRVHAKYGGRSDNGFGFLLEAHQWQSDGFQTIDRSSNNTGLDVSDFTAKLSYAPNGSPHAVELKLQLANQDSNQSYLGLTDADFAGDAMRRYGLSELDNIETEHEQVILRYNYDVSANFSLSATAYNNTHYRNWFKTEGIDLQGSASEADYSRTSWANVINAVNAGTAIDGVSAEQLQGILDGSVDTPAGSLQLRSNNRDYFSRGIQFGGSWDGDFGGAMHSLRFGLRLHEDEEDRFQRNDAYSQTNGKIALDYLGSAGGAGNRVQSAQALAFYVHDEISVGNWTLSPGLRYEDIDQDRVRYTGGAARNFRDSRENSTQVWLPGLGVSYQLTANWSLLGGAHKGFTAPTNSPGVDEEVAINYELGARFQDGSLSAEVIGFLSDYDNLLGQCTASSGSDCVIGDAFNGDAATVAGLEALLSADLSPNSAYRLPLTLSYTRIDGEFDTAIADTDFFGTVEAGDPLPYLPENQLRVALGVEAGRWATYLSANYVDDVCVRASCEEFERTDDSLTIDVSASYQLSAALNLFARAENLTNTHDIMGRQPYGARPNKERTLSAGLRFDF